MNKRSLHNMDDVANILNCGLGRNQLYDFLKQQNVIDWSNAPKLEFISKGYLVYDVVKNHGATGTSLERWLQKKV